MRNDRRIPDGISRFMRFGVRIRCLMMERTFPVWRASGRSTHVMILSVFRFSGVREVANRVLFIMVEVRRVPPRSVKSVVVKPFILVLR